MTGTVGTWQPSRAEVNARRAVEKHEPEIRRLVEQLSVLTGERWTFGYIGNLELGPWRDSRWWSVWPPHPERPGKSWEHIGGVRTEDLAELRVELRAVVRFMLLQTKRLEWWNHH